MSRDSLFEKMLYKKKYAGKLEKDGKVYVRYSKRRRFKLPESNTIIIFVVTAALIILYFLVSNLVTKGK